MSFARENCQTEKRDRNEIITVAKILLINEMVLIINCDVSSIVLFESLKFDRLCFSCQIDDFV